jgi:hypothetical protein
MHEISMLWEYVEGAPTEEEAHCMGYESFVAFVEIKRDLQCGRNTVVRMWRTYVGHTYIKMSWTVLSLVQRMWLEAMNACGRATNVCFPKFALKWVLIFWGGW